MKMKAVFLLFLFCLAEADDLRYEVKAMFQQLKSELEAQNADMASRLSASETKIAELQTGPPASETKVVDLQTRLSASEAKTGELQTRLSASEAKTGELQTRLNQLLISFDQLHDDMKMRHCESPGWQRFDRGCYYISTEKKTWEESRQWCRDRQSDLIVIKSKAKQDFVASFNKRMWLGLTDREEEGSFRWVDGTPLTTPTYWSPGEPEDEYERRDPAKGWYLNAEEDCVEYYDGSGNTSNRGWNDATCSISIKYWMCERAVC